MNPREAFGAWVAKRYGVRRLCAAFACGAAKKRHSTGALQNLRNPDTGSWKEKAMVILGIYTFGLPLAAFAASRREVPFNATEVATWVNFGTALDDGANLLM